MTCHGALREQTVRATRKPLPSPFLSSYLPSLSLPSPQPAEGGTERRTHTWPLQSPAGGRALPAIRGGRQRSLTPTAAFAPAGLPHITGWGRGMPVALTAGYAGVTTSGTRLARGRCVTARVGPPKHLRRTRHRFPALTCNSLRRPEGSSTGHPLPPAGSMAALERQAHVSPPSLRPHPSRTAPRGLPALVRVTRRAPPPLTRRSSSRTSPRVPRQAAPASAPAGREGSGVTSRGHTGATSATALEDGPRYAGALGKEAASPWEVR